MHEQSARHVSAPATTNELSVLPRIELSIRQTNREYSIRTQQSPRGVEGASRIGKLVEAVPDGDGVEGAIERERVQRAVVNREAERASELVHVLIDVDTLAYEPDFTRRGQEG